MRILRDDPLLLVFVVAAVGYLAGRIRIAGFGFGVAAVLFAGLAFGMADPQLQVPRSVWTLGLVLFVYTVGLAAGPGFVAAFRRRGVGANVLVFAAVAAAAGTVTIVGAAVGLDPRRLPVLSPGASRIPRRLRRRWRRCATTSQGRPLTPPRVVCWSGIRSGTRPA